MTGIDLTTSEVDTHGLKLQSVRQRWDPWDKYACVSSGKDGENIRRAERDKRSPRRPSQILEALVSSGQLESLPRATSSTGDVVYLIQRDSGGAVKIGHTTNAGLNARLKTLQTAHDEELVVRELLDGGAWLEGALHALFIDQRARGEWFRVSPLMLDLFPSVVG